eukprot:5697440-Amphidinium_carterae.1
MWRQGSVAFWSTTIAALACTVYWDDWGFTCIGYVKQVSDAGTLFRQPLQLVDATKCSFS